MNNLYLKLLLILIIWQAPPILMVLFGDWRSAQGMTYSMWSFTPALCIAWLIIAFHRGK